MQAHIPVLVLLSVQFVAQENGLLLAQALAQVFIKN